MWLRFLKYMRYIEFLLNVNIWFNSKKIFKKYERLGFKKWSIFVDELKNQTALRNNKIKSNNNDGETT